MRVKIPSRAKFSPHCSRICDRFPLIGVLVCAAAPADSPEIFPLDQVKPEMKGVAYTVSAKGTN